MRVARNRGLTRRWQLVPLGELLTPGEGAPGLILEEDHRRESLLNRGHPTSLHMPVFLQGCVPYRLQGLLAICESGVPLGDTNTPTLPSSLTPTNVWMSVVTHQWQIITGWGIHERSRDRFTSTTSAGSGGYHGNHPLYGLQRFLTHSSPMGDGFITHPGHGARCKRDGGVLQLPAHP